MGEAASHDGRLARAKAAQVGSTIEGLGYRYGSGPAVVEDVSLEVRGGECVALLGASGSGKTTLLQLVAGLLDPVAGRILLGGAVLAAPGRTVPPERRRFGMVFQDFALWPHMTVAVNVAFPRWCAVRTACRWCTA